MTRTGAGDGPDDVDDGSDDRRGPGTALWITLVVAALVLGGAIGWRVTKASDTAERPAARLRGRRASSRTWPPTTTRPSRWASTYLEHGTDPLLRQIASEIVTYQASEIGVMNDHLAQWERAGHGGLDRDGMDEHDAPRATRWSASRPRSRRCGSSQDARGRDLDQLFTRLMICHHEGGIHMAEFAAAHATTETVRSWAQAMADGQTGRDRRAQPVAGAARPPVGEADPHLLSSARTAQVGYGRMRGLAASRLGTITLRLK